jgi:UDP-N-acetyl-D-glucosamine dehydrogenase
MPSYVVQRLLEALNSEGRAVAGGRVLLAGVAYKPGVSDTRESPAEGVVRRLRELGADVGFTDPMVSRFEVDGVQVRSVDPSQADEYDSLIVVTNHDEMDLVSLAERIPTVLDTRGVLPPSIAHRL